MAAINVCMALVIGNNYVYDQQYPIIEMPSKSKGLILRVAGVLHVQFHLDVAGDTIKEEAIIAAQDFVFVCCQHSVYWLEEEILKAA